MTYLLIVYIWGALTTSATMAMQEKPEGWQEWIISALIVLLWPVIIPAVVLVRVLE